MYRDPSVYIILSLNTHMEVEYSTTHLFDEQGQIARSRVCHGDQEPVPVEELEACLEWGAANLSDHWVHGTQMTFESGTSR